MSTVRVEEADAKEYLERWLLPQHQKVLTDRAISAEVAAERKYASAESIDLLHRLGFGARQQQLVPCLVIPRYGVDGEKLAYQIRPDIPRLNEHGKPAKYELPAGEHVRLDVHPRTRPVLNDPAVTLAFCESALKADAVLSAGNYAIGMNSTWGWWAAGPAGGRLAVPCFEFITLTGRTVFITADSDVRSNEMVALAYVRLYRVLDRRKAKVRLVAPQPLPDGSKVGVDDFLAAGGKLDDLFETENLYKAAQLLVSERFGHIQRTIAYEEFEFYPTSEGIVAAERHGKNVAFPAGKGEFTERWAAKIYHKTDEIPRRLDGTLQVICGEVADRPQVELPLRVGSHDGAVIVDLGREDGQVVRITDEDWTIESRSPIPFRRSPKTGQLPLPETRAGVALDEYMGLMNISADDRPVVLGVMVATFFPRMDHPVLALLGPQGSGKTGVAEAVASITDPVLDADGESFGVTALPDIKDWAATASSSWCLPFDNVSYLTPEMSDMLCRTVTGDGITRRKLYTDNGLIHVRFRRCLLMTGITIDGIRPDLAERMIRVECPLIDEGARVPDSEIARLLSERRPAAFAQLLDLVVAVRDELARLQIQKGLPRLADFGRILLALDTVRGTTSFERMKELVQASVAESLIDDPVTDAVVELVDANDKSNRPGEWKGTATELLSAINRTIVSSELISPKGWPGNPRQMGKWLARNDVALRQLGIWHDKDKKAATRGHILVRVPQVPEDDVINDVVTPLWPETSLLQTLSEVAS